MLLLYRLSFFSGALLASSLLFTSPLHAQCTINGGYNEGAHSLVNGRWKESYPEVSFKVPGASIGNGVTVSPDSVINGAANNNHVRFRLRAQNRSSTGFGMYMDSSIPLSCVSCAANMTIPFSKISWTVGEGGRGAVASNGQFNNGLQKLINAAKKTDNISHLQFHFANDEVLPAGTYEGQFLTRGIPQ